MHISVICKYLIYSLKKCVTRCISIDKNVLLVYYYSRIVITVFTCILQMRGVFGMGRIKQKISSSIKMRIIVSMVVCITIVTLALGIASTVASYVATMNTLEQSVFETSKLAGANIDGALGQYKAAISEVGEDALFSAEQIDSAAVEKRFAELIEDYEFKSVSYTDEMGITPDGKNVSFEEYFSQSKVYLKAYVSDLYISAEGATLYVSAPIMSNDEFKGVIFAEMDGRKLSEIIKTLKIGEKGSAFVLNQAGDLIAGSNFNDVLEQRNIQQEALEDSSLKKMAEIQGKMTALTSGVASCREDGANMIIAYFPIPNTENWSVGVKVNKGEFLSGLIVSVIITLAFAVAVFVLAIIISRKIAASISNPVLACAERMKLLAKGDVTTEVPTFDLQDETGVLAEETAKTVYDLSEFINEVSACLSEIASGNLAIKFEKEYNSDFAPIGDAIRRIITQMNSMIGNIKEFSQIVMNGAEQVSSGAQAHSQGATEQASAVEELAATIEDVSRKINTNAEYARSASSEVENVNKVVGAGNGHMKELVAAMHDINSNSYEIKNILETIEDIAFQTNILALNAAIEAAKAGVAGRGFSVVAEEVKVLSEKCTAAAQSTAELITTTIASVEKGNKLAAQTAASLGDVVAVAKTVTDDIEKIAEASDEQAESISEITGGVDQIACVVQSSSATAEESAAASTELSEHAKKLASLVESFIISDDYAHIQPDINESIADSTDTDYEYTPADYDGDDKYFGEWEESEPESESGCGAAEETNAETALHTAQIFGDTAEAVAPVQEKKPKKSFKTVLSKAAQPFVKLGKTVKSAGAKIKPGKGRKAKSEPEKKEDNE